MVFEDYLFYKVATNDYVFDSPENPFIYGQNVVDTGILIRDVLADVMTNQKEAGYDTFSLSNPIVLGQVSQLEFALYINKNHFEDLFI